MSVELNMFSILREYLNKGDAKYLAKILGTVSFKDLEKTIFPSSLFANEDDLEKVQLALIMAYVVNNWEEVSKKSEKWWVKRMKEKESNG